MNTDDKSIIHSLPEGEGRGVSVRVAHDTQAGYKEKVERNFFDDRIHFPFLKPKKKKKGGNYQNVKHIQDQLPMLTLSILKVTWQISILLLLNYCYCYYYCYYYYILNITFWLF